MSIDIYSATGEKKKTMELAPALFETGDINYGLMHQAVVMQQANRRQSPAHVKTRGEVWGSTKKLFQQKHTCNARRGDVRSPLLRHGGKTFGPRNDRNFTKDMPQKMRHSALRSCLAIQAQNGAILGLESFPSAIKTKTAADLLKKLPLKNGRILFVIDGKHEGIQKSMRNIPRVKCVYASYLNPEDLLVSKNVIFLVDAFKTVETVFGKKEGKDKNKVTEVKEVTKVAKVKRSPTAKKVEKAPAKKKSSAKKAS